MEKKTPLSSVVSAPNGHALTQRYEALRRDVVKPNVNGGQDVRSLALLVRKGMAAWMRDLCQPCAPGDVSVQRDSMSTPAAPPERCAVGIEQMLVNILVAMTQANSMEVCT
jgi:hypothetical protein